MFREIVAHSGLSGYAVVGLVCFVVAFGAALAWLWLLPSRDADRFNRLPLQDDTAAPPVARPSQPSNGVHPS